MKGFVLDASVTMRWILASSRPADQSYAEAVLKSLSSAEAIVPSIWHLEVANVLLSAISQNRMSVSEAERFTAQLENLPLSVDMLTSNQAFGRTTSLAKAYRLSSYDSAYLELSLREGVPIASLDAKLRKAAVKSEVEIYLADS